MILHRRPEYCARINRLAANPTRLLGVCGVKRGESTAQIAADERHRHHSYPNRPLTEAHIRLLLNEIGDIRDDALIRLGLSVRLRLSEVVGIRTSKVDFERGLIKIWDEKKDLWRFIIPTNEALSDIG